MKVYYSAALLCLALMLVTITADAQRGRIKKPSTETKASTLTQQSSTISNSPTDPYAGARFVVVPGSGGFADTMAGPIRKDGFLETQADLRVPLPYENVRPDDLLFAERIWREIDVREKINHVFSYRAEDRKGDQRFISLLVRTIRDSLKKGKSIAFSAEDDRFTTQLSSEGFEKILRGNNPCDTIPVYSTTDPTQIDYFAIYCNSLGPDDIVRYRIKEDWVFDKESSRMLVRIVGIAPLKRILATDGKTERGVSPLFWVYYPDIRPMLANHEVYNPKNMGQGSMTWEELFESRMFSSYIVKSTLDNPQNRLIRGYIKDPALALLEGDNIKEKIFNYEQNLWSY